MIKLNNFWPVDRMIKIFLTIFEFKKYIQLEMHIFYYNLASLMVDFILCCIRHCHCATNKYHIYEKIIAWSIQRITKHKNISPEAV